MESGYSTSELLEALSSDDPDTRTEAWLRAGEVGAPAIQPLSKLVIEGGMENYRAAKRAIWKIVRTVGSPGTPLEERESVVSELEQLLKQAGSGKPRSTELLREVIWMLSEIGESQSCEEIGVLLFDDTLQEDARCALERIPGETSVKVLQDSLRKVPDDFKNNIVQSLRVRGIEVEGYPCRKMVPKRQEG